MKERAKVLLFANTDWYLFNFRLALAERLRSEGIEVLMLSPPGVYGERLRAAGFRWEPVPMRRRSLNPVRELFLIGDLVKRFRRERPDIVHAFTVKCAAYGSIAARLAHVPGRVSAVTGLGYVFTNEGTRAVWLRPAVRRLLRMGLKGGNSLLILQNPDDVTRFLDAGVVGPERVRLIPSSGVNCERFMPAPDEDDAPEEFRVLFVGRLLWEKGVGEYVEAARLLRKEGRRVKFLLAGRPDPGNPGSVGRATVEEWAREGLIEWLGHVEHMDALLKTVHVLALPSYYGEGVPRSLIEGAASGLPLVTTDMPGCREVVTHEREGLLVPSRDARALARAIARLDDNPILARKLGQAARAKAVREFDERVVLDRTLAAYRELVPGLGTDGWLGEL
jgi:glycosyltransferase involved in cell wall biosynthesis